MASTDNITSANRPIKIGDVEANRPNSESVNQKIGGSVNFLLERLAIEEKYVVSGFFNANSFDDGVDGITYIEKDAKISLYSLAVRKSGSSGTSAFNIAVYDGTGAFVNNLFGTGGNAVSISGANGTNVLIGKKDVDTVSPSNFAINTAGHTVFHGTLNITTLLAGYMLVPFVVSNGNNALNLSFKMRLKEI